MTNNQSNFRGKNIYFLVLPIFFFLISISLVNAASPVLSTTQAGSLEIIAPTWVDVPQSQDMDFYWHVLNTSTLLTNVTANCTFHLYSLNSKGEHIYSDNHVVKFVEGRDFEVSLKGSNFSTIGEYCKLVECNTAAQTGALERCFNVVSTTQGNSESKLNFPVLYLLIIIGYGLLIFGFTYQNNIIVLFSSFLLFPVSVYIWANGIQGWENYITQAFAAITLGVAAYTSANAGLELMKEGSN